MDSLCICRSAQSATSYALLAPSDRLVRRDGDRIRDVLRTERWVVVSVDIRRVGALFSCQTSQAMYRTRPEATRKQTSNMNWPANGCQGYSANISQIVNGIINPAIIVLKFNVRETVITIISCARSCVTPAIIAGIHGSSSPHSAAWFKVVTCHAHRVWRPTLPTLRTSANEHESSEFT